MINTKDIGFFNQRSELFKAIAFPLLHLFILFLAYKLLHFMSAVGHISDAEQFKQWDSNWYASIAEYGYQYSHTEASNSGFFPLFPYMWKLLWKLTGSGVKGICILNLVIFFLGMLMLKDAFKFSWAYFMLFLSIPSNFFMYVPYTEAAFFFFSALMLTGLKKNNQWMIFTGLFFSSLTRPTALFFIPAIICMEIFSFENFRKFFRNVLIGSLVSISGILIVTFWQWKATGVWFAYFKAQTLFWKRNVQLPEIPFTTWDGPRILWLDGLALFFGLLAIGILLILLVRLLRKKDLLTNEKAIFFSLCYIMMAIVSVTFFNSKDDQGTTSLYGANRYVFSNPCFILMLLFLTSLINFEKDIFIAYILLAISAVFLLRMHDSWFVNYDNKDRFYYGLLMVVNILLYVLASRFFNNKLIAVVYLVNVFMQVIILCQFASGSWVG